MSKKWLTTGLGITGLLVSTATLAATQTVATSQPGFEASSGDLFEFDVKYSSSSPRNTTGLGLKLYFDSSKISLQDVSEVFAKDKIAQSTSSDTSNGDDDSTTDKKINVAWAGLSGDWPGTASGETKLLKVKFKVAENFSSATKINFTGDASAGNSFASTPVTITPKIVEVDTTAPSITAPVDVTIEAKANQTIVTAADLGIPTVSDDKDPSPLVSYAPTTPLSLGVHTITWTAKDNSNNEATDTQTVTVVDTTAPQIQVPGDLTVSATGASTSVEVGTATATDLVDGTVAVTSDSTGSFAIGTHTVTWTAKDASNNTATATQTIVVADGDGPTIIAPADIIVEATGATTPVNLGVATASDSVDGALTATPDNQGPFTVGIHTITWTATDSANNTATATQTVTVVDTTPPQIQVPGDLTVSATGASTSVEVGAATATDLVDGTVVATSDSPGSFAIGTHTVTWTAKDASNNTSTATQTIVVADGDGPTITAPADITVEATGATTPVTLGTATATDIVDGTLTATPDNQGPFTVGIHTITWTTSDSANNSATATQTVTITDSTTPEITSQDLLKVTATGVRTVISDFHVTATDIVDGTITPAGFVVVNGDEQALPLAGLESGRHQLIWKATDNANNTLTVNQVVEITPLVNFVASQAASAGDTVAVNVELTGEAVSYPVKIPYSIDTSASTVNNDGSDHNASSGEITIESGTSGSFSFKVADNPALNGNGKGDLVFAIGNSTNAVAGNSKTHKVSISADNIAPIVNIAVTQSGNPVSVVTKDAGKVAITATATDSASQALVFDWSQSNSALTDLSSQEDIFEFDPSSLPTGIYSVVLTVKDNGSPVKQTTVNTSLIVKDGSTPAIDTDGDGIVDDKDNVAEPNRLPSSEGDSSTFILESEAGTKLNLGDIALEQGTNSASISTTGLPEIPDAYQATAIEIYDFEIVGVEHGKSTLIVLPQHIPIPEEAVYLKSDGSSWKPFVEDQNNVIYSSESISEGVCPPVGDSKYKPGLKQGDHCVQLKIEDGGANDTDGLVNGSVADPGVVVGKKSSTITSSSGSSGGGSMSWFFVLILSLLAVGRSIRK